MDIVESVSGIDFSRYDRVSFVGVSSGCDAVLKSLCFIDCVGVQVIHIAPVVNFDGYQLDKIAQCMESLECSVGIVCNRDDAYALKNCLSIIGFFNGYRIQTHHLIVEDGGHYLTRDNFRMVSDWVLDGID